jgi:7-cyano-7-deazaguanine reductase
LSTPPKPPLRGFYRIEPVVVMSGKIDLEANGNGPKTLDADVTFRASAIKWPPDKGAKRHTMTKPPQLGRSVPIPASPRDAVLDRVPNPHADSNYVARFTFPEFTALCPITGQPDFATLVIDYVPGRWLVESKSLKLYLNSFRNHGAFHEDCTVAIGKRLVALVKPKWLRIGGYFHPRGGMPIDVFWQAGKLPQGVWAPDQGVTTYRARS